MKILQIHNRYREPGGEDTVVAAEHDLLRTAGHEVMQYQAENPTGTVRTGGALALATWNPFAARRVGEVVESFRPDVAHVHNTWYSLSASTLSALRKADVPVVMTLHNYRLVCSNAQLLRDGQPCELCVGHHPLNAVRYRCYRDSYLASAAAATSIAVNGRLRTWEKSVSLFLALTEFAKSRLVAGGFDGDSIRVKPNFVADPGDRQIPASASNKVLFVGRLSQEKGVSVLLEAWEAAAPELELVVIGSGPLEGDLEAEYSGRVRFLGRLSAAEVRGHMLSARALVFPTQWYEGQPMVVLEAFAAGLPVLATRLGSVEDMIAGHPRWLVSQVDGDSWRTALDVLGDSTEVDKVGAALRREYLKGFTPEANTTMLQDAYATAMGKL